MLSNYKIIPNTGYGNINFGSDMGNFVEKYGEPEEVDSIDEGDDFSTTVLHYWKEGVSIFFIGTANPVLAGIETDHHESELFDVKIMGKTKDDIIALMKEKGYSNFETEDEEYSGNGDEKDLRISYEHSMMDFFFRDNLLVYMNFGVMVDENGNIDFGGFIIALCPIY